MIWDNLCSGVDEDKATISKTDAAAASKSRRREYFWLNHRHHLMAGIWYQPRDHFGCCSTNSGQATTAPTHETADMAESKAFVATILADTEDVWTPIFAQLGHHYQPPSLVLFSGAVQSACGSATSASGPFYCPADQKYI